jgi:hypothetical protein
MNQRMKILAPLLFLALGGGFVACGKDRPAAETKQAIYHCPMHPTYVSDRAGDCPICGMRLVPMEAPESVSTPKEKKLLFYRNPMNPEVTSPVPMKDEMGMD